MTGAPGPILRILGRRTPRGWRRLWRASFQANRARGACWAEDPRVAVAYTLNPNHGGGTLWTTTVPIGTGRVIDLAGNGTPAALPHRPSCPSRDAPWLLNDFDALGRIPGASGPMERARGRSALLDNPFPWEVDPGLKAALERSGRDWVRYLDGWPRRAITWTALRTLPARPRLVCRRPAQGTDDAGR